MWDCEVQKRAADVPLLPAVRNVVAAVAGLQQWPPTIAAGQSGGSGCGHCGLHSSQLQLMLPSNCAHFESSLQPLSEMMMMTLLMLMEELEVVVVMAVVVVAAAALASNCTVASPAAPSSAHSLSTGASACQSSLDR